MEFRKEWKEVEVWEWEEGGWRDTWVLRKEERNNTRRTCPLAKEPFLGFRRGSTRESNIRSASGSPVATSVTD